MSITPIDGVGISKLCDYSFGDQAGVVSNVYGAFMKEANRFNYEFMELCKNKEVLTLFIDNIRLYKRTVHAEKGFDRLWIDKLYEKNDLFELCALLNGYNWKSNKFVIFSGLEDTPIDDKIKIPDNVLHIYATNALYWNDKITPMPYGLQRKMNENDNRIEIMSKYLDYDDLKPSKLLYMNLGIGRNDEERRPLLRLKDEKYCTVRLNEQSMYFPYDRYSDYIDEVRDHKFMICPMGHGVDCHRNWECLYMRRVPVMRRTRYLEKLFEGFPVLFVNSYDEVNEELLNKNAPLFERAKTMDLTRLDINNYYDRCIHNH